MEEGVAGAEGEGWGLTPMNRVVRPAVLSVMWLLTSISAGADKHAEPRLIDATLPHYPGVAEAARISGEVQAEFRVSSDGAVSDVRTLTGNPILQRETQRNIQSWKFSHLSDGKDSVVLKTTFVFGVSESCVNDVLKDQTVTITLKSFHHVEIQIVPQCPQTETAPLK